MRIYYKLKDLDIKEIEINREEVEKAYSDFMEAIKEKLESV